MISPLTRLLPLISFSGAQQRETTVGGESTGDHTFFARSKQSGNLDLVIAIIIVGLWWKRLIALQMHYIFTNSSWLLLVYSQNSAIERRRLPDFARLQHRCGVTKFSCIFLFAVTAKIDFTHFPMIFVFK